MFSSPNFQAQVRPVVPTLATVGGGTQVRMVAPRQATIARHTGPVRIQTPINMAASGAVLGPRIGNATVSHIRTASGATIVQQHPGNAQIQSNPPALQPVSQTAFVPSGAQVIGKKIVSIFRG